MRPCKIVGYLPALPPVQLLRLNLPRLSGDTPYVFTEERVRSDLKGKKIKAFTLDGDPATNHKKLLIFRHEALLMQYTEQKNQVLQVHFTEEATYGDLVSVFLMMQEDRHHRYVVMEDDFYLLSDR